MSVGVARQYCGQLGKKANCQSLVSLTLAQGEVPVPVGLRLFLPDDWALDAERCARAGVPDADVAPRSKGEVALAELDRVRPECGLAPCWPTPAMGRVPRSAMGWMPEA